jgi:uncharacterized OsmC-like protein
MNVAEPSARERVNGIDIDAVEDMMTQIGLDPSRACASVRVRTEWKGQVRSESKVESLTCAGQRIGRDRTIVCDEPTELLGEDTGPNPQELLISALNGCLIIGYVVQAAMRGIKLADCRIETEGELDLRGFLGLDEAVSPGYRRISYTVHLDGDGTREQLEEIHEEVMATSPNFFNLAQPVQMRGRLA